MSDSDVSGHPETPDFAVPGMHKLPFTIGDRRPCVAVSDSGQLIGCYFQPVDEKPGRARALLTRMLESGESHPDLTVLS